MRKLVIAGALGTAVVSLAACGGSSGNSTSDAVRRQADMYAIGEIEKNFHKATSHHDIGLMMSLWAPNATFTLGPGQTAAGKEEIREFWLNKSVAFQPSNHWVSDTPAYKVRITVNGDRGTLHFECHYIDADTQELKVTTAADQDVARIDGRWLITNMVGGTARLTP